MRPDALSRQTTVHWLRQGGWWLLGLVAVLAALGFLSASDTTWKALRYDRLPIAAGEWWRLITGQLIHGSVGHLLLNLAGLGVVALLFPREYSPREWFLIGSVSAGFVAAGLWWLNPEVDWYVGSSGALHGALAAGAVAWWRSQPRALAVLLAAILVGKLIWEQWQGAFGWSGELPVIVDAHLYGAAGGLLAGIGLTLKRGTRK